MLQALHDVWAQHPKLSLAEIIFFAMAKQEKMWGSLDLLRFPDDEMLDGLKNFSKF